MRFLLHAPLQLASVLFAASSTTEVCGRFFASTTSLGCMGAVSFMQLSLGVFLPGLMCHLLDMRSTAGEAAGACMHRCKRRWRGTGTGLAARLCCTDAVSISRARPCSSCPPLLCADKPYLPHVQAKRWLLQS